MKKAAPNVMLAGIQNVNMAHKEQRNLLSDLKKLKSKIKVGDRYYHYKHPDQFYHIVALGFIEATEEPCVVYEAEYGDKLTWVRTESKFFAKVDTEGGSPVDRFTKVE